MIFWLENMKEREKDVSVTERFVGDVSRQYSSHLFKGWKSSTSYFNSSYIF